MDHPKFPCITDGSRFAFPIYCTEVVAQQSLLTQKAYEIEGIMFHVIAFAPNFITSCELRNIHPSCEIVLVVIRF